MAHRKILLVKDEIYHLFNRGVARQPIFKSLKDYQRAIEVFRYYQYSKSPLRFSFFNRLPKDQKDKFLEQLKKSTNLQVDIICFCLMPNHFHFLVKNLTEKGINKFMSNFQNSYAKFFNTKLERDGSLFQQNFKAVRIESDEQLIHVSRYIHLNPVTAYLVKTVEELINYPWSSYREYLTRNGSFVNKNLILNHFRSVNDYKKFLADQVDYQRKLDQIKHLTLE